MKKSLKIKNTEYSVDIGSHDGISINNTYFFERELEWTGLCIEPNLEYYANLVTNRPHAICLPYAVSNYKGVGDFLKSKDIRTCSAA